MRVLVCGSREWTNKERIRAELEQIVDLQTVIHGNARGADRLAGEVAKEMGIQVMKYPADWPRYGKGAGVIRNQEMLDIESPHLVIAFRKGLVSAGTDNMIRRTRLAGIELRVVEEA
jgi:hypothetical protein